MGKIRGTHSSPGIYTKITDLQYAAKSLGITTLGLVGETKKGPAFEPVAISDWAMFQDYFGGTSPEKFKDSQMPKYELPYIAKSYLSASDQLYVCRVLGLSGYNAGPAWALCVNKTGATSSDKYVIGVLRSRGKYSTSGAVNPCETGSTYDSIDFDYDGELSAGTYSGFTVNGTCSGNTKDITKADALTISGTGFNYPVSLIPGDKDYIYNVLGSTPIDGTAELFVESFYDMDYKRLAKEGYTAFSFVKMDEVDYEVITKVKGLVKEKSNLIKRDLNDLYLADENNSGTTVYKEQTTTGESGVTITEIVTAGTVSAGTVYKVIEHDNTYVYLETTHKLTGSTHHVYVLSKECHYTKKDNAIVAVSNISDYREQFRHAMTPWFVSELQGDNNKTDVKKLFRFHTITDGTYANEQIKITIANVRPDEGTFDVLIRDFNDSDANQTILESYKGVNMVPGSNKYIGLKIGTLNGDYELKSKYVMVEVVENDMTETCVPCGFLGYPTRIWSGCKAPSFVYNTIYDDNIKVNKQCFGLSDNTGIDVDMLYYKGKDAYTEKYVSGYTNGFHLDSRLTSGTTVDGESVSGWDVVNGEFPVITSEEIMSDNESMYAGSQGLKLRKFTCCPYGGFDGWDIYRGARTNGDNFKANKYKGAIGVDKTFSKIQNGDGLALEGNAITSDYYAYLAGYRQFANPEKYVINLFATPGIDYVNNKMLTEEVLDMVHDRMDTFYVMTTPDKSYGAGESTDEMYSAADVVGNLEDSAIDTYYASTYYPWVRCFDAANSVYISLPVTKDVLRNMANVDNKSYPWFAPAGIERGDVDCVRARIFTKLSDEDEAYDGRINPVKTFSADGVKIWGNKTLYTEDTPMNRINTVRLVLYMRKLIKESVLGLVFEPNDTTLKSQFEGILKGILNQIKSDRGITDYRLVVSQTPEQMDAHEISARLHIKSTPTLEYIEIDFVVTPQGVEFED